MQNSFVFIQIAQGLFLESSPIRFKIKINISALAIIAYDNTTQLCIIAVNNQGRERDIFAACDKERFRTNDDKKMFLIILFLSIIGLPLQLSQPRSPFSHISFYRPSYQNITMRFKFKKTRLQLSISFAIIIAILYLTSTGKHGATQSHYRTSLLTLFHVGKFLHFIIIIGQQTKVK